MFTMPLEQALRHMNSYKKIPPKGDACPKVQKTPKKGYPRAASLMRSRSGWGSGGGMSSEMLAAQSHSHQVGRVGGQGTSPSKLMELLRKAKTCPAGWHKTLAKVKQERAATTYRD